MNYYFYNGNIFTEQNMKRAGYDTDSAQLLTDNEVSTYLTDIKDGYRRVSGKLELELVPVVDNSAKIEYTWAQSQLDSADIEVNYYIDEDESRQTATLGEWKAYRRALRDYVTTSTDTSGDTVYTITDLTGITYTINDTEYPVTVGDSGRPLAPSDSK